MFVYTGLFHLQQTLKFLHYALHVLPYFKHGSNTLLLSIFPWFRESPIIFNIRKNQYIKNKRLLTFHQAARTMKLYLITIASLPFPQTETLAQIFFTERELGSRFRSISYYFAVPQRILWRFNFSRFFIPSFLSLWFSVTWL